MAKALRFVGPNRTCDVPVEEAEELVRELRKMGNAGRPDATAAAVVIESALAGETAQPGVSFEPAESAAVMRVLYALAIERGSLSDALRCLRDAFLIGEGLV